MSYLEIAKQLRDFIEGKFEEHMRAYHKKQSKEQPKERDYNYLCDSTVWCVGVQCDRCPFEIDGCLHARIIQKASELGLTDP